MVGENDIRNAQTGYQQPRPQAPQQPYPQQPRPAQPYPQPQQPTPQPTPSQYAQYQQQVQQAAAYRQYQLQMQQRYAQQQAQQRAGQQYPQQNTQQAQQMQQPTMMPQPPDAGHHKMLAIAAVLVVVFAGLGTYFTMMSGGGTELDYAPDVNVVAEDPLAFNPALVQSESTTGNTVQSLDVSIDKLIMASVVNEDLTYVENSDKIYSINEPVYIYMEVKDFTSVSITGNYVLDISEDIMVMDPEGNIVPYLNANNVVSVKQNPTDTVAIQNMLTLAEDAPEGEYTAMVKIRDKYSKKEVLRAETFTITR
ncbi:MAG: hypothetical protein ABIA62_00995 [Candidatus Woesearchaeota archaeon]